MIITFWYRTYSIYGGNATLNVAGTWLSERVKENYGGKIESVLIEFCAGNVSPPRKTLDEKNGRFESFLKKLPIAEITDNGKELRICSKLVKHYHDEIDRDSQVLSLKVLKTTLNKSATLLRSASDLIEELGGFDNESLAYDIEKIIPNAPTSLEQLAKLYIKQRET